MSTQKPQTFTISYDMVKTKEHRIDAITLGRSLVSMAELIKECDKLLNGEDSEIQVDVQANREGSFEVEFIAWLSTGGIDVLKAIGIGSTALAMGSGTLFGMLKSLKNRKISSTLIHTDVNGLEESYLKLEDGTQLKCPESIISLLKNHSVRKKIDQVFLQSVGDDKSAKITIAGNDLDTFIISGDEIASFKAPPKKIMQEIDVTKKITSVTFVQVNLESRNGWKAKIKSNDVFSVKMDDDGFLARINSKKDFPVKDELFDVELETTLNKYDGKKTISYRIIEVKKHRASPERKIL